MKHTRILLIIPVICIIAAAGCIGIPDDSGEIPETVQLTANEKYNLYYVDYTGKDYHLDELLGENITSEKELAERIGELAAPGTGVRLNLPNKPACTAFLGHDNGSAVFGRNFDLSNTSAFLVHTMPDTGYESYGIAVSGMITSETGDFQKTALLSPYTCMDGINSAGVGIAVLSVDGPKIYQNRGYPVVNAPLIIRLVLDKAGNVSDAVSLIDRYDARMIAGYQFFIADSSGDTATVNYVKNETVVTRGEPVVTNFYLCPIPEGYPEGHGQDRYISAKLQLEETNYEISADEAMDILSSVAQYPGDGRGITQWSAVYSLSSGEISVAYFRNYTEPVGMHLTNTDI